MLILKQKFCMNLKFLRTVSGIHVNSYHVCTNLQFSMRTVDHKTRECYLVSHVSTMSMV